MFKRIKKTLAVIAAGLFCALAVYNAGMLGLFAKSGGNAGAAKSSFVTQAIDIPNGGFTSSSGSFPKSPSDWTGSGLNSSGSAYAGVVSLEGSQYSQNRDGYHFPDSRLSEVQDIIDTYPREWAAADSSRSVLMINTLERSGSYAFTSQSVTIDPYRRVEFSVSVKTFNYRAGGAAIALLDADGNTPVGESKETLLPKDQNPMMFKNIDTAADRAGADDNGWRAYRFLIETSYYPVSVKLSLQAGTASSTAQGAVFFKDARAKTLTPSDYDRLAKGAAGAPRLLAHSFIPNTPDHADYADRIDLTAAGVNGDIDPYFSAPKTVYEPGRPLQNPNGKWEFITGGMNTTDKYDADTVVTKGANLPSVVTASPVPGGGAYSVDDIMVPFDPGDAYPAPTPELNLLKFDQTAGASAAGARSGDIRIERYRYYRLSVWYKTLGDGKVSLALTEPSFEGSYKRAVVGDRQSDLSSDGSGLIDMEKWSQASFYIKGASDRARNLSLELWLGYGGQKETFSHSAGIAYFYGVELCMMSPADFNARSGGGAVVTLTSPGSDTGITNGGFRDFSYDKYEFPLVAEGWAFFEGGNAQVLPGVQSFDYKDERVVRGILPTDADFYRTADPLAVAYGSRIPSGSPAARPANALMILNNHATAAGYASSPVSVGAFSYGKISVLVSHEAAENGGAYGAALVLKSGGKIVSEILDIRTGGRWQAYSFFISTGESEASFELLLLNGQGKIVSQTADSLFALERRASGAAFFANAAYAGNISAAEYDAAGSDAKRSRQVDFKSNFGLAGFNDQSALKPSYSFTGVAGAVKNGTPRFDLTQAGALDTKSILDSDGYLLPKEPDLDQDGEQKKDPVTNEPLWKTVNPGTTQPDSPYVLMVGNTSATGFKLVSGSRTLDGSAYYEVSVSVKTYGIPVKPDNMQDKAWLDSLDWLAPADKDRFVSNGELPRFGAMIALTGIDGAYFNGINTETGADNEYAVYTFYIRTGDSVSFNFELGLGDPLKESTWSPGWAFFDNVSVKTIDKARYDATEKQNKDEGRTDRISILLGSPEVSAESPEAKTFWDWMWIPSVIFGLAILIALGGFGVRRVAPFVKRKLQAAKSHAAPSYARRAESLKPRKPMFEEDEEYIDIESVKHYVTDEDIPYEDVLTDGETESADAGTGADEAASAEDEGASVSDLLPKKAKKAEAPKPAKKNIEPEDKKAGDYTDYFED